MYKKTSIPRLDPHQPAVLMGFFFFLTLILAACSDVNFWKPHATPEPTGVVEGRLHAWVEGTPIVDRHIVLCRSLADPREGNCDLMDSSAESDFFGRFRLENVPPGTYFVLYDSGLSDFDQAMDRWSGKTLHFGNQEWLTDFLGADPTVEDPIFRLPEGIEISPHNDWMRPYCLLTLLIGNSPFIIAHDLDQVQDQGQLSCELLVVVAEETAEVEIQVIQFDDA